MRMLGFDTVDSTMLEAERQAEAGVSGPLLIWARSQTGGVGRHGRAWASPPGNLYWTMLLDRAPGWPADAGLTFAAGLAVLDTVEAAGAARERLRLKWPNDCLLDGRKVAGVLIRASVLPGGAGHVVVGVGVNLASAPPNAVFPATCLADAALPDVAPEAMRDVLTGAFMRRFGAWTRAGLTGLLPDVLARLHGVGERVRVALDRDRTVVEEGVNLGLDRHGALKLRRADGSVRVIPAGDLLPQPAD